MRLIAIQYFYINFTQNNSKGLLAKGLLELGTITFLEAALLFSKAKAIVLYIVIEEKNRDRVKYF